MNRVSTVPMPRSHFVPVSGLYGREGLSKRTHKKQLIAVTLERRSRDETECERSFYFLFYTSLYCFVKPSLILTVL